MDASYPYERCGVITNHGAYELANRHTDPANYFRLDRRELRAAVGREMFLGIWHTHPAPHSPYPSIRDHTKLPKHCIGAVVHPATRTVAFYDNTKHHKIINI